MYSEKAFEILDASINNAVFIDEKAKEFYSETSDLEAFAEEKLSKDLYNTFKTNGKNLTVHRFVKSNIDEPKTIEYLFKGKDLILLDWELDGVSGLEYSLNLLHKAVSSPNINFCCVYSNSKNFADVPLFLDTYFSGLSREQFESIKDAYSHFESQDLQNIINKNEEEILNFSEENEINSETFPIVELKDKSILYLVRLIYISLEVDKFFITDNQLDKYEVLNTGENSFMINNTFVLTLKKDFTDDADYGKLVKRISEIVIKNEGSFFQLLGLEMQSVFNDNESFIDNSILKSSTEALFQFRNHLKDDKAFGTIIKKLLLEQATLKLRTAKLSLLKTDFLDSKTNELADKEPTHEALFNLNVFYNSVKVKSLHPTDVPNLNFGDVFKGSGKDYYLCITALCDCLYPNKIDSNFYFAKGEEFDDLETALRLGDTAFLSFLPNGKVVLWGDKEIIKKPKIKQNKEESDENFKVRKESELLKIENEAYKKFLYKPFFIKPKVYNVEDNKIIESKLRIWDITNKLTNQGRNHDLNYFEIEYVSTLRDDYTQRIANHAFGHPSRVGVDFAKIQ
ncbi:response regulator receiver domain [Flavobacterium bizetiae]|uniref:response regulator receiver domain n=1 Tax=Flavobacterium bizetiae TaxID=2704140 RepID=UPI0037563AA8